MTVSHEYTIQAECGVTSQIGESSKARFLLLRTKNKIPREFGLGQQRPAGINSPVTQRFDIFH